MKDYYIKYDEVTGGYGIYKRHEDSDDEKICIVFSVDHTEIILGALAIADNVENL